jgi:hypothetical protein
VSKLVALTLKTRSKDGSVPRARRNISTLRLICKARRRP